MITELGGPKPYGGTRQQWPACPAKARLESQQEGHTSRRENFMRCHSSTDNLLNSEVDLCLVRVVKSEQFRLICPFQVKILAKLVYQISSSFFSKRPQFVQILDQFSKLLKLCFGVPQGSNLSPASV